MIGFHSFVSKSITWKSSNVKSITDSSSPHPP
jgi:hypothetical protein